MNNRKKNSGGFVSNRGIVLVHWNCFHIANRIELLKKYMGTKKPDLVMLNEIKLDQQMSNFSLDVPDYITIAKPRKAGGGGVALLIREDLKYVEDRTLDSFGLELLSIKIRINNNDIRIISMYNPPSSKLNEELFRKIKEDGSFILGGDLNAKHLEFGCTNNNANGQILYNIIDEHELVLLNNGEHTHNRFQKKGGSDILDLFICSRNLADKVSNFYVEEDNMTSDHFPIVIEMDFYPDRALGRKVDRFNFNRANWTLFKEELINYCESHYNDDSDIEIEQLNKNLSDCILKAALRSIPKIGEKTYKMALPRKLIFLKQDRMTALRRAKKSNSSIDWINYKKINAQFIRELVDHQNKSWEHF